MKSIIVTCLVLLVISFYTTTGYAACALSPENGPYTTVIKYYTGKKTVMEKWECAQEVEPQANGVCFYNVLDNSYNTQYTCISGEFKVLYPVNDY